MTRTLTVSAEPAPGDPPPAPPIEMTTRLERTTYGLGGSTVALHRQGQETPSGPYIAELTYMHGNHLGSMTLLTDENGDVVDEARYYPFGGYRQPPTTGMTDIGFTGHRQDNLGWENTGLIYMGARYYEPVLRRFISADTIVPDEYNSVAYNRFAYAYQNPVNMVDPTGRMACPNQHPDLPEDGPCLDGGEWEPAPDYPPGTDTDPANETPVVNSHQGDTTVFPGIELTRDDLLLVALAVFSESQNAAHPDWAMELWVWILLSRIAQRPSVDPYLVIVGATDTWQELFGAFRTLFGEAPKAIGPEQRAYLLDIANFYSAGGGKWGANFQGLFSLIVGDPNKPHSSAMGIYDLWLAFGSNSSVDPTHGAIFAVHRDVSRLDLLLPIFQEHAANDPLFSYGFSGPYRDGMTMTVFGNQPCIYDYRVCH